MLGIKVQRVYLAKSIDLLSFENSRPNAGREKDDMFSSLDIEVSLLSIKLSTFIEACTDLSLLHLIICFLEAVGLLNVRSSLSA